MVAEMLETEKMQTDAVDRKCAQCKFTQALGLYCLHGSRIASGKTLFLLPCSLSQGDLESSSSSTGYTMSVRWGIDRNLYFSDFLGYFKAYWSVESRHWVVLGCDFEGLQTVGSLWRDLNKASRMRDGCSHWHWRERDSAEPYLERFFLLKNNILCLFIFLFFRIQFFVFTHIIVSWNCTLNI